MNKDSDDNNNNFNLADLTDFQFGPSWARQSDKANTEAKPSHHYTRETRSGATRRPSPRRRDGDSSDRPRRNSSFGGREQRERNDRGERGERPQRGAGRFGRPQRVERERPERPEPTPGLRVELRPANNILEVISQQVQKNKRVLPLMKLATLTLAAAERCDLVLMKLEDGSSLIHSKKGDHACWLTESEALTHLWTATWFGDYYRVETVEVEAPKGTFTAIAVCKLGRELIGPVNWHGYQAAVAQLHKNKYSKRMSLEDFRREIKVEKDEDTLARWQEQATKATVWKPTREGADELVLADHKSLEADFLAHHYSDAYEVVDKVFINCATAHKLLSPGLAAHLRIQHDRARRFPQMIIPNLCHGLARHHMPIFKWHGHHYTGPSRIRVIPEEMVLADRMNSIISWVKENSGQKVDAMFATLTGVSAGEDEASIAAASEAHAPYTADLIWLLDQGFIVVTDDNAIWDPKGTKAPEPEAAGDKRPQKKNTRGPRSGKAGKKPAQPAAAPAAAAPSNEAAQLEAAAQPSPEPAAEQGTPEQEAPAPSDTPESPATSEQA